MQTPNQPRWQSIAKEIYVGVVGWIWIAAVFAAIVFTVKVVFFDGVWWPVFVSAAVAWLFYKVSLYYVLEKEGRLSPVGEGGVTPVVLPSDATLSVLLPKEAFMTLQMGVLRLTERQLTGLGLSLADRKNMLDHLLDALKPWYGRDYANIPEQVNVSASVSAWKKMQVLLAVWKLANPLQEEEIRDLRRIIGATLRAVLH
jgi:hypothetical protein